MFRAAGERAAVIVFRACLANTLETAYQLRDAGEFMVASQSIVPIAGIWPWGSFLTSLMPGATSGDVAQAIARQLALFLETPENRDPFALLRRRLLDFFVAFGGFVLPLRLPPIPPGFSAMCLTSG